ncbi:hypothetical protein A3J56_00145 [Candidatus Giovannonibacteria bacterium RIFCSPHIGHO2_02_FULL_46_20]|uniref:Cell division protein FtsX n=1 Tax=Candidatus Giovannonibacteria bacterium RIFCSPHIGHO2_02_FULL_46_20 TaxID=1798338 RepID=A0A1F5WD55_9BACT|nr:MAG: hypothetical protein A3J56_00145 [Candidatus Giovannonibacteria bacterium RIFCSPHIGHO2_02_FULL_46_20]
MKSSSLQRIIKSGVVNFFRNGLVSIATVFIISLSLFLLTSVLLGSVFLHSFINELQNKVDVSVYFKRSVAEADVVQVQSDLERLPEVKEVVYVSRDEALARFKELHREEDLILQSIEVVGDNPFSASIEIRARDPSQYEAIASFLERDRYSDLIDVDLAGKQKITYRQNQRVIDQLTAILATARAIGLILGIGLAIIAVVIAYNTVRLAIYNSRDEISVMQLVGASYGFVRGPFIVEGILHGFIAFAFTMAVLYPFLWWLGVKTAPVFGGLNIFMYFVANIISISALVFALGIGLGVLSSILAIRRYLRV